tara:strand:- start:438 stop:1442 length:1005 start_codon:yes stop_codon:yes gene_type:complete
MPIHLIWGDDSGAKDRYINNLIKELVDSDWLSMNLSRFDGNDINDVKKALEETRTPPFGFGGRVVLVQKNPFCNNCTSELGAKFEEIIELIPEKTNLILSQDIKPDGRLKTTKLLQKLIQSKKVNEQKFLLPAIWDENGQRDLVEKTAEELGLKLEKDAIFLIVESIGNDSARLHTELEKFSLLESSKGGEEANNSKPLLITTETVNSLLNGVKTNVFQIGDALLRENIGEAISKIDTLLDSGEPGLRILASLTTQIRGWLWVSLLENQQDVAEIAKTAGIANPKRIYVIRKQIKGKPSSLFLNLLVKCLEIEASLKKGVTPSYAFKDSLITQL